MTNDELDRLAAEKVMGWNISKMPSWGNDGPIILEFEGRGDPSKFWKPTSDITQAWQCLEKLNPEFLNIMKTEYGGKKLYLVEVSEKERGRSEIISEAIVRACLKAKGIEV